MQRHPRLLFVGLIFCAALSETFGLVLSAKEKRGWTVNSAGYLLGPHAIDRIFSVKHGLAGKRDLNLEENVKADTSTRLPTYNNIMRTIIEFLAYLHLKGNGQYTIVREAKSRIIQDLQMKINKILSSQEAGALDNIVTTVSSEERDQS